MPCYCRLGVTAPVQDPTWKAHLEEAQKYERAFLQTRDRIQSIIDNRLGTPSGLRELPRLLEDFKIYAVRAGQMFFNAAMEGYRIGMDGTCGQQVASDSLTPQAINDVAKTRFHHAKEIALLVEVHKGISTALVPGGGLTAHEGGQHDGHTIAKHIGQSEEGMRARLAGGKRSPAAVSTFPNQDIAERSIARALLRNETEIKRWKEEPSSELAVEAFLDGNVGVIISKTASVRVVTHGVRAILCKDTTQPLGFSVKTAYPILCPPKQ